MQRNRLSSHSKQSSPVMSRSLIQHVAVGANLLSLDDDEDNDICPVCDGDCTCNNRSHPPPSPSPAHASAHFVVAPAPASCSSSNISVVQPLKIKLTVPPSIQNKVRSLGSAPKKSRPDGSSATFSGVAASSSTSSNPSNISSTVGHGRYSLSDATGTKRRGRPPKAVMPARDKTTIAVSDRLIYGNEATTLPQSQSHLQSHHALAQRSIASRGTRPQVKSSGQPKVNLAALRQTPKSQARGTLGKKAGTSKKKKKRPFFNDDTDSDLDLDIHDTAALDEDEDDTSSGRFPTFVSADALTSEASDSSESDLDSDSSGFGSDSSLAAEEESYILAEQRRQDKARIRRELLGDDVPKHKDLNNAWVIRPRKKSVGLSDVDTDGDTDDITENEEDDEEEMEEDDEDDDETDGQASRVYTGIATGWSDDEESSFDADIFFANLTDTSSDDNLSDEDNSPLQDTDAAADHLTSSVSSLRSVDFEVTEAWDGQIVFTNGSSDGHGVLDLAFEANAAQLVASDSASISHDSDVEMRSTDDVDCDDGGDSELGESDGDTTEEELVDERGLPTSRAMRLFQWPTSVSSINPLSTVTPNVSPAPFSRRDPPSTMLESPRPADILAGKTFWEESDHSQPDSTEGGVVDSPRAIARGGVPLMGQFNLDGSVSQKTAVLNGENKDIPSPYPRLGHKRRRFSSSGGSFSSMDLRGRMRSSSLYTSLSSLPPPSDEPSSEATPETTLGEPIQLDDVLDSTFLNSDPESQMQCVPDSEDEERHAQSLSRWDRVPVGAFRLTREPVPSSDMPTSPGWTSEPTTVPEVRSYSNALKSSPLHTILWHDKSAVKETPRKSTAVIISPVLLPVRDGDLTPTHAPYHHDLHSNHHQYTPYKTRKESRREMKMLKRKTHGPLYQQHDYHHQRHHRRNHHPNMKSRGNASVQRTFLSSPTSSQR